MEFQAQVMSLSSLIPGMIAPVLVAKGPNPHELAYTVPFDAFKLHVGEGTFTCCEFNHKMQGVDIPCDKVAWCGPSTEGCTVSCGRLRVFGLFN